MLLSSHAGHLDASHLLWQVFLVALHSFFGFTFSFLHALKS